MRERAQIKAIARPVFRAQWGACFAICLIYGLISTTATNLSVPLDELQQGLISSFGSGMLRFNFSVPLILLGTVASLVSIFISPVLEVGLGYAMLEVYTGQETSAGRLFGGFKNYGRNLGGMLMMRFMLFLWVIGPAALLLAISFMIPAGSTAYLYWYLLILWLVIPVVFIPAFIKGLAYGMTNFILADSPNIRPTQAYKLSNRITRGHKGKLFVLGLSFFGWMMLTMGIATLIVYFAGWFARGIVGTLLGAAISSVIFAAFLQPYMQTTYAGMYLELKQEALNRGIATPEEFA